MFEVYQSNVVIIFKIEGENKLKGAWCEKMEQQDLKYIKEKWQSSSRLGHNKLKGACEKLGQWDLSTSKAK